MVVECFNRGWNRSVKVMLLADSKWSGGLL
jgi:hypothetical protein